MDCRLKKLKAGHIGLNLGLCPGTYRGRESHEAAIHIAEASFCFLEPGIRRHCPRYAGYAHWGVTAISREEWFKILDEWEQLKQGLDVATLTTDLQILRAIMKNARREFIRDFDRNRAKLSKMIAQLVPWMRTELIEYEHITVLGI
jgi:hypothetical protein